MKIIIVGCGKMGKYLSLTLTKEKYDVGIIHPINNGFLCLEISIVPYRN